MDLFGDVRSAVSLLRGLLRYGLGFLWLLLQPKAMLAAKVLALQSQLVACVEAVNRRKAPRPRFGQAFRLLWVRSRSWWKAGKVLPTS